MIKKLSLVTILFLFALIVIYHNGIIRLYRDYQSIKLSKNRAEIYRLKGKTNFKDITEQLILDNSVPTELKKPLIDGDRKIIVFKYRSDGNNVAGYLSYLTNQKQNPTVLFLRGGNKFFGLMRPNNRFSFLKGCNIVGTLYRGNIYNGQDEFGGEDVNDVENLIKFLPQLEQYSNIKLQAPYTMMGVSRGALEMFLSLQRSKYVQQVANKAISVSGNVDLQVTMEQRPDMKFLFKSFFKNSTNTSFEDWVSIRNPVQNLTAIPKSLEVLLVYGLSDERVSFQEQLNLKQALEKEHIHTKLVTIPEADHGFENHFNELENEVLKFINSGKSE
ncbi:TPA: prolyl oligopeptidase family serine peptidase [Legionella pneumophila]|nr:prolyl oligopeptidase family serine peptidase [Legionella pneumophila]